MFSGLYAGISFFFIYIRYLFLGLKNSKSVAWFLIIANVTKRIWSVSNKQTTAHPKCIRSTKHSIQRSRTPCRFSYLSLVTHFKTLNKPNISFIRNLEGDDGTIIPELIQGLMNARLLMETSMLESEPDLNSLVHTPGAMMGEPHTTFPRILAMVWLIGSDPITTKKNGWCSVKKVSILSLILKR